MDCRKARRLAEQYANREPAAETDLQAHFAGCHECRSAIEASRLVEARLEALVRPVEPRPGFEQRVSYRLDRRLRDTAQASAARRWRPVWVFAAGAAAGLLVGGALSVLRLSVRRGAEPFSVELPSGFVMADEAEFAVRLDSSRRNATVEMRSGCVWLGNDHETIALAEGERAEVRSGSVSVARG